MSLEELLTVVRPFSLVTPDMLLDAIQEKTQTKTSQLPYRGLLCKYRYFVIRENFFVINVMYLYL